MNTTLMAQVVDWSQFGLAGAVIGGLFGFLVWTAKGHRTERTEWRKSHTAERKEWRDDAKARAEKTDTVIKELSQVIRDMRNHP